MTEIEGELPSLCVNRRAQIVHQPRQEQSLFVDRVQTLWRQWENSILQRLDCALNPGKWCAQLVGDIRNEVATPLSFAAALLVLFVLLILRRSSAQPGEIFWRFVLSYGLIALFLSAYQANPRVWGPGIRLVQVFSLVGMLVALFVLSYYAQSRIQQGEPSSIPLPTNKQTT